MLRWNDQVFLLHKTNTKCERFVLVKMLLFGENVYKIRDWNNNHTTAATIICSKGLFTPYYVIWRVLNLFYGRGK